MKKEKTTQIVKIAVTLIILFSLVISINIISHLSKMTTYPDKYFIEYKYNNTNDFNITQTYNGWSCFLKAHQEIPIKSYNKIGLEYFCTIEFTDTLTISEIYKKYGKFSYELIRYKVWKNLAIESSEFDLEFFENILTSKIGSSDTFCFDDIKIYNLEKYTFDKYIEKRPYLYTE